MLVAEKLRVAVKASRVRQYEFARRLKMQGSTLSAMLNGAVNVRPNDPRIIRLAEMVNVPADEAFSAGLEQECGRPVTAIDKSLTD